MKLEDCLKEFEELTGQIAPVHAVYGPGGTWILRRDRLKAQLFAEWFDTLTTADSEPKRTDVDQRVLTDPRWEEAIEKAEQCRRELFLLYGRRQALSWMIQQRGYMTSETEEIDVLDLSEVDDN